MSAKLLCKFRFFLFVVLTGIPCRAFAQPTYTVSGHVRDARTGETLVGASLRLKTDATVGTRTNNYGFYSLTLAEGTYVLVVSHVGYQSYETTISLGEDKRVDIDLPSGELLDEVVISQSAISENVRSPQMGVARVGVNEIKHVPVLMGEKDVLKTIQLLPGVLAGGEGSSNFFVRGGAGDQNLILLDEAMVYNASHLFGFFSTFNSDAIKDVNLFKGGMPAQYGGRLASVLDIAMLDGNKKRLGAEGGVGLIASRLKIDGPIVKDKGSFMVSGRRTYADLFLKLANDESINSSRLYFYDLNAKANYRINEKNALFLSGYFGRDVMGYSTLFGFDWGNTTTTLRWNHVLNSRLFSNTSFIYSNFNYNVNIDNDDLNFVIASRILNYNVKQDFQFFQSNKSTWRFGINLLRQNISPANIDADENTSVNSLRLEQRKGMELAGYLSHEWKPLDRLNLVYGVRATNFLLFGPGMFYEYDAGGDIVEGRQYERGDVVQNYFNLEPRLSMSYQLPRNNSLKLSYNRNTQHLHQLSNSTSSLPTDTWVMSSNNIKPQIADQAAVGYYQNFLSDTYEFSVESYYKYMQNQIDYRNAADLQANEHIEAELLYGIGRAYGVELFLKKREGRLNGWLSYTLSRSERRFDDINQGNWFTARQDRTHDVAVVGMYQLSPKWNLSATFIYSTGNAVTFPSGKYSVEGRTLWYYTERNGYRMPDYHRLDLGATWESSVSKRFTSSWTFGVYNAYNRKNAYIIDFRENEHNPNVTEAYRIALFGIIPSVTWNFKF
ncbi:TonB-dependent receptor [Parapedobacter koreensis]|uniref:Outer membrane receptor for ferrienterochelin and colicins n=1 Tax=Parapedobacter koreensis TaxID=332977 RepID=A0A1H7IRN9_9SPHI|nr:TonB-dependent receptor [Parapedobacter koreensis]SEK64582.1 Outer membrane receptor for ferrienterochelin and colicins [Parapedobacter koreensis]